MLRMILCLCLLFLGLSQIGEAQTGPAVAQSAEQAAQPGGEQADATLRFSFQDARWDRVLKWLAEKANLTLDITDLPPGTFNYIDDREHTVPEAMDAINGYLLPRGYVTLRRNQFLVVVKTDNPILPNLIPTVPPDQLDNYGNNELLRIIVNVPGHEPGEVAEQIEQFLGSHGKASPLDASQSILLQGFGKSLRVAEAILSAIQTPVTDDELEFRSFPLKHIPAADAERQIQKLFGLGGSNPYAERRNYYRRRRRGRDDDDDRRNRADPIMQNLSMNMKVSSLGRTNSVLVAATPSAINLVENILESIDVQRADGVNILDDTTPVLKVYFVDEADEDDVAETVNAIMPGVVINEDGRHDSIHIFATPREHKEVEKLIRTIDGGGGEAGVEVIPLYQSDPYTIADLLSSLFDNEDRDDRPVITPELRTRSLVIRATSSQMAEIKKTLAAYGETGSLQNPTGETQIGRSSRFRTVSVPTGRAERIARAVKDMMSDDRRFGNPIRVVVPGEASDNSPQTQKTSNKQSTDTRRSSLPESRRKVRVNRRGSDRRPELPETLFAKAQSECSPEEDSVKDNSVQETRTTSENRTSDRPRVTIEVRDGELFMYSSDGSALNEIEDTIRELARQMPARTNWTVFYLRAAKASETASQLGQLLTDNSDPYVSVGLPGSSSQNSSYGAQSVRIIPDSRTNALFISGPESKIEEADRFLELLDTNELPPSLRDRVPRTIPVKHADVNAVADMVRELYKDYMEDPNARRARRRDDRRDDDDDRRRRVNVERGGDTPQPVGIRLTLTVDARASELIVSCDENLFQQIQEVVENRDQAALDRKPQIQIVTIEQENTQSIADSLDALSSKITIGTTSSGDTNRRSSTSNRRDSRRPSFRFDPRRRRDRD